MRTPTRTVLALAMSVALASCNQADALGPVQSGQLAPIQPHEVVIRLTMSGGITGTQFGVVVDGAAGEARYFVLGQSEGVVPLSPDQVSDLAQRLDEAGAIAIGDHDFGSNCCDMIHMTLTYERGERSVHLSGTQTLWPFDLISALQVLSGLTAGWVPVLVSPESDAADWPRDALALADVTATSSILSMAVTFSGGCAQHPMDLILWGAWLESFPVQINALLTHDDGDDECDAIMTEERVFWLLPLRNAYVDAYGPIGSDRPTVVLRLRASGSNELILVEIVL